MILTSRNYKPNMVLQVAPKNAIDTVTSSPYSISTRETIVDTHTLTTGRTPSGTMVNLPMANSSGATSSEYTARYNNGYNTLGNCHVSVTTVKGSYTIELEEAPSGPVEVSWNLSGTRKVTTRGAQNVATDFAGVLSATAAANFVDSHVGSTYELHKEFYHDDKVNVFPWVTESTGNTPSGTTLQQYMASGYAPTNDQVLTRWFWPEQTFSRYGYLYPKYSNWPNAGRGLRQGTPKSYWTAEADSSSFNDSFIDISGAQYAFNCSIVQRDIFTYVVSYELPVRYVYLAGATVWEPGVGPVPGASDSYGILDVVDSITITATALTESKESVDISYGLDPNGFIDEDYATNKKPYKIELNTFVTGQTKVGNTLWVEAVSQEILTKYKNGKFIAKCTVPARWAVENGVHVNSQIQLRLQDGTLVPRIFKVKTIEKVFEASQFVYNLGLLEV